jgi:hypothetical protein
MVTAQSGPERVAEYRDLLLSEWKKNLPDEVLALLWRTVAAAPPPPEPAALSQLLDPGYSASFPVDYFRSMLVRIRDAASFVRVSNLPEVPAAYAPPKRLAKPAWLANRLAAYLTLQAHSPVAGDVSFLADAQSLAFQAVLHFVLPEIREKYPEEHAILLHAAVLYAVGYSVHGFAHYAYMIGMVHDYLGNEEQRLQSLYASFRCTPPTDHSYLTKAQELWSELLDRNREEEAERFLVSLPGWSLPSQQDEVREMVVDAFRYIVANDGGR